MLIIYSAEKINFFEKLDIVHIRRQEWNRPRLLVDSEPLTWQETDILMRGASNHPKEIPRHHSCSKFCGQKPINVAWDSREAVSNTLGDG